MQYVAWIRHVMDACTNHGTHPHLTQRVGHILNLLEADKLPYPPTVTHDDDCVDVIWSGLTPHLKLRIGHTHTQSCIEVWRDGSLQRTSELTINNARVELCNSLDQIACRWAKPNIA